MQQRQFILREASQTTQMIAAAIGYFSPQVSTLHPKLSTLDQLEVEWD
jgi:hypothetical protein